MLYVCIVKEINFIFVCHLMHICRMYLLESWSEHYLCVMYLSDNQQWWTRLYSCVFKCLLTVLITSAGEDDADTWMKSMIHVKKGVEVCNLYAHLMLSVRCTIFWSSQHFTFSSTFLQILYRDIISLSLFCFQCLC
jgi:hypothetical protein